MPRAFRANRILSKLSASDIRDLAAHLEPIALSAGMRLYEEGASYTHMYFPLDCLISMVAVTEPEGTFEVALIGREGMAGVGLIMGLQKTPARAVVQKEGAAVCIPAPRFLRTTEANEALRGEIQRFGFVSMTVAMLVAACNNKHGLEARLARWLLMTRDWLSTSTFPVTQRTLADMLGVSRPSVSAVASELQRRGLISYRRGTMKLLDPEALLKTSCKCYGKIRHLLKG